MFSFCGVTASLIKLIFQSQIIGYHRDKFAIGGLSAIVLDSITEIGVKGIDVAPIPRDLDGVADGTLNAACGGLIFFRDGRV